MNPAQRKTAAKGLALAAAPFLAFLVVNLLLLLAFRFVHMDTVIRVAYDLNTLAFPGLFGLLALWHWRRGARKSAGGTLALALLLAGIRLYATHIEPHQLQVREVTLTSPKLSRELTILHLSDIQSDGIDNYEARVFARIRALNPDLVCFTGDLLQPTGGRSVASELPKLAALLATLDPPLGLYGVEGESDTALRDQAPEQLGGLRWLHTESITIQRDDLDIRLLGLALNHTRTRHQVPMEVVETWLASCPDDALTIVLGHRPDYATRLTARPIDLCLAGHTHGGQVRLPIYGAIVTSSGAPRDWARGFRAIGTTHLNVSAGVGAGHNKGLPAIRLNCPPEITLIRIVPID